MRAKKFLLIILSLIMALSLFTGCGESSNDVTETASPAPSPSTAQQTSTPEVSPTAAPTPTSTPAPTEAPGMSAVITVADSKENWNVYGSTIFADSDENIERPLIRLQHIPDPTEDTQYDSYASVTFTSDKACTAEIAIELICPDAMFGASGYILEYFVNEYNEDSAFDMIELDYEAESLLYELQSFVFTVELQEGENTLYFLQRTGNNAGGWRIDITSATVTPYGDAVISGYTEPAEEMQ